MSPIKLNEQEVTSEQGDEVKKGKFQRSTKKVMDESQNTKSTSMLGNQGI